MIKARMKNVMQNAGMPKRARRYTLIDRCLAYRMEETREVIPTIPNEYGMAVEGVIPST